MELEKILKEVGENMYRIWCKEAVINSNLRGISEVEKYNFVVGYIEQRYISYLKSETDILQPLK